MLQAVIRWAPVILDFFSSPPDEEHPTISSIEILQDTERAKHEAQSAARATRNLADRVKRDAERGHEQARICQERADRRTARTVKEMKRMKTQMEETSDAAERSAELAEASAKATKEDTERFAQQTRDERGRAQKMRQDAVAVAKEVTKRAQMAADEQRREAEVSEARAQEMIHTTAKEVRKATQAKEEVEERLKKGIQPIITPSPEELAAAKRRIQYREDCFHFAVAGISGSGKSSLVNAFRGLRSNDSRAAAVGVTETTLQMTRYQDANPDNPIVWYDVPGGGTLQCRDWQYFHNQGLYVFDCIIVLFDNRFTMTDVAILANARRFNIPTYIVRSKADQHIRNIMEEIGYADDDEDIGHRNRLYNTARNQFIDRTRKSVQANLEDANLPSQRVYIVSSNTLLSVALDKTSNKMIDEVDLVSDLFNDAYRRRENVDPEK